MSQPIELHPDPPTAPINPGGHRVPAALLAAAADREDWQQRALCAQTDPEAFFPEHGGSTAEAKAVCARCPVTAECLEHVLAHDERFGVWAGLSEAERRKPLQAARVERAAARRAADQAAATRAAGVDQAGTHHAARESAPPPGPSRHVGGIGPVATLPTEPRHARGRPHPARNRSTFPARARQDRSADEQPPGPSPAAATRPRPRPTRGARSSTPTFPRRFPGRSGPADIAADQLGSELAAASPSATVGPETSAGAGDEAGAATLPARPPDPPPATPPTGASVAEPSAAAIGVHELFRAVAEVLAGQPDAPALDPAALAAHAFGPGTEPRSRSVGEWELRILAVASVISGRASRGQTARALGVPSPAVAHWVARHQQQMPLCAQPEEAPR